MQIKWISKWVFNHLLMVSIVKAKRYMNRPFKLNQLPYCYNGLQMLERRKKKKFWKLCFPIENCCIFKLIKRAAMALVNVLLFNHCLLGLIKCKNFIIGHHLLAQSIDWLKIKMINEEWNDSRKLKFNYNLWFISFVN